MVDTIRVVAEKTEFKNLKPGELFSNLGPDYWTATAHKLPASALSMRTNDPDGLDDDSIVYRLTVVVSDAEQSIERFDIHKRNAELSPHAPPGATYEDWNRR